MGRSNYPGYVGFAEQKVRYAGLPSFRAEHFPYSGPYPWLDEADAGARVDGKLARGEITASQGELCRKWSADGYIVLPGLIEPDILDRVWTAYERAAGEGRIQIPADPQAPATRIRADS